MIKLVKANKYFNRFKRNQIHVIDKTSLEFEQQGLVALLGPSGCGKTTLLNVIGGLDKVNSGNIYINNKKLGKHWNNHIDKIRNLNIGYIFQDYNLVEDLTVFDNVALSLKMIGVKDAKERKRRVDYVLEKVGLYRYRNRLATMLSGGERQRVGIARAIVKNPPIIIADEPTGNLDSRNTLEIMNIIKEISKDKLVILVTHEKELAYFYATRIVELLDGKVVKDYENNHQNELDYRIDQKIYLYDMPVRKMISFENVKMKYFCDDPNEVDVTLVVKKGNVYIQTNNNKKIENVTRQSAVELIEDNYQKISQNTSTENPFNMDNAVTKQFKPRYKSVFNVFSMIGFGFRKVFNYSFIKKALLLGFAISAMFTVYSFSNIVGLLDYDDSEFTTKSQDYLSIEVGGVSIDDYQMFEQLEFIKYIIPSDSMINFNIPFNTYYQTQNMYQMINGSLVSTELLIDKPLMFGQAPVDAREVVLDKMTIDRFDQYGAGTQAGLAGYDSYIGQKMTNDTVGEFIVVGIVDNGSPCIYVDPSYFINLINHNSGGMWYGGVKNEAIDIKEPGQYQEPVVDYTIAKNTKLKKGRYPVNDYEVMVNYDLRFEMKLNKKIGVYVNGQKLKVVGYFTTTGYDSNYYVNNNMIKYNLINNTRYLSIVVSDKQQAIDYFKELNLNVTDTYELAKFQFLERSKAKIFSGLIYTGLILAVSLIEVLLMIRASFLSRIKEVGVYRAIGMKKREIYKMFMGEIIAISLIASIPGGVLMYYILTGFVGVPMIGNDFVVNLPLFGLAMLSIIVFNVIFGLLPVLTVLIKKPAAILARTDV